MSSNPQESTALRPLDRGRFSRMLLWALVGIFFLHLVVIPVAGHSVIIASRLCTAALVLVAALCAFQRASLLPLRERSTWLWAGTGILMWAVAHAAEAFVGHSSGGSVLNVDASDFIYVCAIFPLLMAFATTRETQSLRAVFALNCAQIGLALVLAWFMLYRMPSSPALAATVMSRIYGTACALLAVMSLLRGLCWDTLEERQTLLWVTVFLWTYLPIELGMDYLTQYHGLKGGTYLDLAWSIPFGLVGWKALSLPLGRQDAEDRTHIGKARLLVECACPLLLNAGIFALAATVMRQHTGLGLVSLAALVLVQGLQAAVVQMNYQAGRKLLLEREQALLDREQALRVANAGLKQLALLDPLTGIANRRRFDVEFDAAWRRAERRRHPLTLMLLDADFFKSVNDVHGHAYGDECLVALAGAIGELARRPDDVVARIGGEEFVLLLPETEEPGAATVAFNLHEAIRELGRAHHASPFGRLTVSIGFAVASPALGGSQIELMEAADKALYQAKERGRNRTCSVVLPQPHLTGKR